MFTPSTEFRTQFEQMDVAALETLIAGLGARIETSCTMGRCFAGLGQSISRDQELRGIAREVLAEREVLAAQLLMSAFDTEATTDELNAAYLDLMQEQEGARRWRELQG